ncbi:MAG: response regulator [Chloroflexota bacterium]|jgi:two-component system phosphate regulon response regulator PhoB
MITILVAEDEVHILRLIQRRLESAGYIVTPFEDGDEALACALEQRPDLLLLDIMLPGANGLEICRQVKHAYGSAAPPVILISARGQQADIEAGLEAGANDYIIKPFSPRLLLERIEAVL